MTMQNSVSGAPLGFRFYPTDAELIDVLRRVVVEKQPLAPPHDRVIHSCNMFGTKSEPSEIWAAYGGPDLFGCSQGLYFFSEIKRVTPKGSYVVRKMGGGEGKWNGKLAAVRIDGDCGPIGQKRTFGYLNKSSGDDGGWLLDEYSVFACPRSGAGKNKTGYDYNTVLCRLRKKDNKQKRKTTCDSPSSACSDDDDQTAPVKKKMRITQGKKDEEFDGQLESQVANNDRQLEVPQETTSGLIIPSGDAQFVGSDVSNEQLEVPEEESTCYSTGLVGSDMEHEMNSLMAVGDFEDCDPSMCLTLADLDSISEEQEKDCGNMAAEEEEDWSYRLVEQLSAEPREEIVVPTALSGQIAENQEDPFFKEFMAEVQRDQLPIASGTFDADGGGLEEACNPSITLESWFDSIDKDLERAV